MSSRRGQLAADLPNFLNAFAVPRVPGLINSWPKGGMPVQEGGGDDTTPVRVPVQAKLAHVHLTSDTVDVIGLQATVQNPVLVR